MNDKSRIDVLVTRAKSGDASAFDRLVRDFQDMAVGYAVTLLGDFHLAEDAAQEAFLAAHQQIGDLKDPAAFPGWFRMVVRTACNRLTRRKKLDTVSINREDGSSVDVPQTKTEEDGMIGSVLPSVWNLPEAESTLR